MHYTADNIYLLSLYTVLVVEFKSDQYTVSESSGFVEVVVIILGGSSTSPISVMVTTRERTATGDLEVTLNVID